MDFLLPVELRPERDDAAGVVAARLPWRAVLVLMTMHKLVVSQRSKTFLKLEVYPSSSMLSTPKVLIIGLGYANGFLLSFWPALCAGGALSCGCPGCVASGCSSSFLFRSAVILPPVGCEWFGLCPEGGASSSVLAARQALQLVASELHQMEDMYMNSWFMVH